MMTSKVRRGFAAKSAARGLRTTPLPELPAATKRGAAEQTVIADWQPLSPAELLVLPWPAALMDSALQLTADDTFEVGRLIVEVVHGGERNTRKSRKPWSLRRLQKEVLTAASFATLARCVQTYETCRALRLEPPLGDVRAGHLLQLVHAPRSKQRHWLRQVDREGLSVEQLRETTLQTGRVTRPRKPGVVKALAALRRQSMLEGLDELSSLPRAEVKKLSKHVHQAKEQLKQVEKALRRLGVD